MQAKKSKKNIFAQLWDGIVKSVDWITGVFSYQFTSLLNWLCNSATVKRLRVDSRKPVLDKLKEYGYTELVLTDPSTNRSLYGVQRIMDFRKPTVIFFHGRGSSVYKEGYKGETELLCLLARSGYNVIAVDPAGYGKSRGERSIEEVARMGTRVHEYIRDRLIFPCGEKVNFAESGIVIGRSLGVIAATAFAKECPCKGEIIIVPTTDVRDTILERIQPIVFNPLAPWLNFQFPILNDAKESKAENALLIYNSYDEFAPPDKHVIKLAEAFPEHVDVSRHDVRRHGNGLYFRNHVIPDPIIYDHIQQFVDEHTVGHYLKAEKVEKEPEEVKVAKKQVRIKLAEADGEVVYLPGKDTAIAHV